jgi:plastocyanin
LSVPCTPYPHPIPPYHPANCAPSQTYLVQPGDNLFRIALNHETTIDLIRSANGLYGRVLRPNMNLVIPCPGSVKYREVPTVTPTTVAQAPPPTEAPQQSNVVRMKNGSYRPPQLTVPLNTTVVWTNTEAANGPSYTVTFGKPGEPNTIVPFDVEVAPGTSAQFKFDTAGTYDYFSRLNPDMTGTITVTP